MRRPLNWVHFLLKSRRKSFVYKRIRNPEALLQKGGNFIYRPGAVSQVVNIACDPANFVLTPAGEFTGFPALEQENNQFIKTTGNIPILLTYGDHDAAFPPNTTSEKFDKVG
jgi:hypothetical protein